MPNLRIVSRSRTDPLSDAETVTVSRQLLRGLSVTHVSYPDDAEFATAVVHEFVGPVPADVAANLVAVIGEFDAEVEATS